jgi:hypothetical protein
MENQKLLTKRRCPLFRAAVWGASTFSAVTLVVFLANIVCEGAPIETIFIVAAPTFLLARVLGPLAGNPEFWRSGMLVAVVNACLGAAVFVATRLLWRIITRKCHENRDPI